MRSFHVIFFALVSILLAAIAQVKTEVGPASHDNIRLFPNMNLDGIISQFFKSVMQDRNGDFLAVSGTSMIIKFTPGSNVASLFAGLGSSTAEGVQATSTRISYAVGLAGDTVGNIYFDDVDTHCVRRIGVDGIVNTFAGSCGATAGNPTDSVAATSSGLNTPRNIFYHTQTNNLYIADSNNHRIRMVSINTNIITTVLGSSKGNSINVAATLAMIDTPRDMWVDSNGVMFVADYANSRIVRSASPTAIVTRFVGTGSLTGSYYPSGIAATSANIGAPVALTGDSSGNIYIAGAYGSIIYRCNPSNIVFSYAQSTTTNGVIHNAAWPSYSFDEVNTMFISRDGRLTVSDEAASTGSAIAQFPTTFDSSSTVSVIAGYSSSSTKSIPASSMLFNLLTSVWSDTDGAIYILDSDGGVIVKSSSGIVTSVAGTRRFRILSSGETAVAISSRLPRGMWSIVGDTVGNLYYSHGTGVSRISPTGIMSLAAGTNRSTNCLAASWNYVGAATSVNLCQTRGLALSTTGVLYFSDEAFVVRRLVLQSGMLSTIVGRGVKATATSPVGFVSTIYHLWLDASRSLLYGTDERHVVLRINLADSNPNSTVAVYAGQLGITANSDNNLPATSSALNNPRGVCGSPNGDVYITQTSQFLIRVVYAANQVMQNYVGSGAQGPGAENAALLSTALSASRGCFVDAPRDRLFFTSGNAFTSKVRSSTPLAIPPTTSPSLSPSLLPTRFPTVTPSVSPSRLPSATPTLAPSSSPSVVPSESPSEPPSVAPTVLPTVLPTIAPSSAPTVTPSQLPTVLPSVAPSASPSVCPSEAPSQLPTIIPSQLPTVIPTVSPSSAPSISPSDAPSATPSQMPSAAPTVSPSVLPSVAPTVSPSCLPTVLPTMSPSAEPSVAPSQVPSVTPTLCPSVAPTVAPTMLPTVIPTVSPSVAPSVRPSVEPSASPTVQTTSTVKFQSTWAFKLGNSGKSAAAAGVSSSRLRIRDLVPYTLTVADQQAIIETQAAYLETSPNNIAFVSAQEDDVALLIYATTVATLQMVDYPELNNNGTLLFQQAKAVLTEAVQSGSFVSSLLTKAAELNSTSFDSSIVTVVLFSDPTVIPAPVYDEADEGLSVGQVAGLVVGCVVGSLLLMIGAYGYFSMVAGRKQTTSR